jgi:hypothetical protein
LPKHLSFTQHAEDRIRKRGFSKDDIYYVYENGTRFILAGMIHIFLRKKDVPYSDRRNSQAYRLIGTTVLIASNDQVSVVTAYRNPESFRRDRKKEKYNLKTIGK